jgi:amidase
MTGSVPPERLRGDGLPEGAPELPSVEEVQAIGSGLGMSLSAEDAGSFREMMRAAFYSAGRVAELEEPTLPVKYPRDGGYRPDFAENPYNAWYWRCDVRGAEGGPLEDMRIGLKDTFCLAGVPMSAGSHIVEGYVPDVDATVVTRLLDAGARIVGKNITSSGVGAKDGDPFATVRNPRKPSHAPGGSSTGCAAALVAGDIEGAMGADQGGSVRIPAAWSGCVGLKPTHGLVPYTGVVSNEVTMTHPGPMANTVRDVARMMDAIAGPDPLDPRSRWIPPQDADYVSSIGVGVRGVRIGIVSEGFGQTPWTEIGLLGGEVVVDEKVLAAVDRLAALGARVEEVSIPMHIDGVHIFNTMYNEGNAHMYRHHNIGTNHLGWYDGALLERPGWRANPDALKDSAKSMLLTAGWLETRYQGRHYARGQNVRRNLVAAYDEALARFDVLVMPTVPFRATPIPEGPVTPAESVAYAMQMINTTCQFGVSGHPAISVPCGIEDDLPVAIQVIGRHLDDAKVLQVADAVEASGDWLTL